MSIIEHNDPMAHRLNERLTASPLRDYMGLSGIGEKCYRKLQYSHYWGYTPQHSARLKRLFQVGHDSEDIMIADLKEVGIEVRNEQAGIVAVAGHWRGHIDGEGYDCKEHFLVEFKTFNDARFKTMKKQGMEESNPKYYHQAQAYMGYRGLEKCLFMCLNKNTSEYYFEWIEFNGEVFKEQKRKQLEVIMSDTLLPRIGNGTASWFECKFCDASDVCFGRKPMLRSCRSCMHVDVLDKGKWACNKFNNELTTDDQRAACVDYELGDMFP